MIIERTTTTTISIEEVCQAFYEKTQVPLYAKAAVSADETSIVLRQTWEQDTNSDCVAQPSVPRR